MIFLIFPNLFPSLPKYYKMFLTALKYGRLTQEILENQTLQEINVLNGFQRAKDAEPGL